MATPTLADVMVDDLLPESYHPPQFRKSNAKTRPLGGGRTPLQVGKWATFEQSLHDWWTGGGRTRRQRAVGSHNSPQDVLTRVHASRIFMKDGAPGISISKEDEVRGALMASVFVPVNEAAGPSGLNMAFKLNPTESIHCVRSNVDWGGFLIGAVASQYVDIFIRCCLPIEVKPPWQWLLPPNVHIVDLLLSLDPAQRDMVRFAVAQLYLYMILEEAEYGVLCSKEQYVFFRRIGNPADKVLVISKTFSCSDPIGIRRCFLFMCHLAHTSEAISMATVNQSGPTPLKDKLVTPKGQKRAHHQVRFPSRINAARRSPWLEDTLPSEMFNLEKHLPDVYSNPVMLSAQEPTPQELWIRGLHISGQGLQQWFQGLAEFDLNSFQLREVLSSGGKVMVREACIWGRSAIIKMFDVIEDLQDTLEEFYREICAYTALSGLQGTAVPKVLAYGSIWGGYMGFLGLTWEGDALTSEKLQMQPSLADAAMRSLSLIHGEHVLHGDLSLRNMVVSAAGSVKFIDFGRCCLQVEEEHLCIESDELEELLQDVFSTISEN